MPNKISIPYKIRIINNSDNSQTHEYYNTNGNLVKSNTEQKPIHNQQNPINLPEVVVTTQNPNKNKNAFTWDNLYNSAAGTIVGFIPGIGDAMEIGQIGYDLSKGNYGNALLGLSLLAIPGTIASKIVKDLKLRKLAKELDSNISNNIPTSVISPKIISPSKVKNKSYQYTFEDAIQSRIDTEDAKKLIEFANKYNYPIKPGLLNYKGSSLDQEYKRLLKRHNTFGRFTTAPDNLTASKYLTTAHKGTVGSVEGMPPFQTGIYTSNGIDFDNNYLGNYLGVVQRKTDFSGPRSTWIDKNEIVPFDENYLHDLQQNVVKDYVSKTGDINIDNKDAFIQFTYDNYPELPNSSGRIFSKGSTTIHGGNPGEKILILRNLFTPYKPNNIFYRKGFSKFK